MPSIVERLIEDPLNFVECDYYDCFQISCADIEQIHLEGAKKRFDQLRDSIPILRKLASEQRIESIEQINDLVPLLFPHTVYKSYPFSYLEKNRFDKLTRWFNTLTAEDLSQLDVSSCTSIDCWIKVIEKGTGLKPCHTSGTTGKLSFLPRSHDQWYTQINLIGNMIRDWHGKNSGPDLKKNHLPYVQPHYKSGSAALLRGSQTQIEVFSGGADNAVYLYPESLSADVASLAGRIRVAESRGELGLLRIQPELLARRDEMVERERQRPERMKEFLQEAIARFGGKPIVLSSVWPILFDAAQDGFANGVSQVFAPGSVLISGGGLKGRDLPDDWRSQIFEFLGFDQAYEVYSMSEMMLLFPSCTEKNYHVPPVLVPFCLDPETGEALPRTGRQTGRFAYLDLLPDNYWGGLVTGDEVTMSGWDEPCGCGRAGPYVDHEIRRYSQKEGGDDKINCAGTPEAQQRAINFIVNS